MANERYGSQLLPTDGTALLQKKFQAAADWYFRTPAGSSREAHNRVLAGQALWQAWLQSRRLHGASPESENEQQLLTSAESALQQGVQFLQKFATSPPWN
ncbi:MAG: hypothetical protein R3C11_12580 [Planctomycetaceae bacterium]